MEIESPSPQIQSRYKKSTLTIYSNHTLRQRKIFSLQETSQWNLLNYIFIYGDTIIAYVELELSIIEP
ncbi:hypothetical protein NIES25_63190 (plasmid) [Nostoc linckia NIES-25]|nr:hypothetical protein NIES25_63190 [Nostoc linckia NIES-25]